MSESNVEPKVEPNSGAAPQPGGYAGPEQIEEGFGTPSGAALPIERESEPEPEVSDEVYEPPKEPFELVREEQESGESDSQDSDSQDSGESDPEPDPTPDESQPDTQPDTGPDAQPEAEPEAEAYDPSAHPVDEVLAYMAEHPDEADTVIAAERAGKNRKGITDE